MNTQLSTGAHCRLHDVAHILIHPSGQRSPTLTRDSHWSRGLAPIRMNWTIGLSVHSFFVFYSENFLAVDQMGLVTIGDPPSLPLKTRHTHTRWCPPHGGGECQHLTEGLCICWSKFLTKFENECTHQFFFLNSCAGIDNATNLPN